jgi:hypothetical protein
VDDAPLPVLLAWLPLPVVDAPASTIPHVERPQLGADIVVFEEPGPILPEPPFDGFDAHAA